MTRLSLYHNQIHRVDPNAFDGLTRWVELSIISRLSLLADFLLNSHLWHLWSTSTFLSSLFLKKVWKPNHHSLSAQCHSTLFCLQCCSLLSYFFTWVTGYFFLFVWKIKLTFCHISSIKLGSIQILCVTAVVSGSRPKQPTNWISISSFPLQKLKKNIFYSKDRVEDSQDGDTASSSSVNFLLISGIHCRELSQNLKELVVVVAPSGEPLILASLYLFPSEHSLFSVYYKQCRVSIANLITTPPSTWLSQLLPSEWLLISNSICVVIFLSDCLKAGCFLLLFSDTVVFSVQPFDTSLPVLSL